MISPLARQLWLLQNIPMPPEEDLWPFASGQTRMLSMDPDCYFRVDRINGGDIEGTQFFEGREVHGLFVLNQPCCVLQRPNGEPIMALTLRRIESGTARIQVSMFTSKGDSVQTLAIQ